MLLPQPQPRPGRHLQTWAVSPPAPRGRPAAEGAEGPSCAASCGEKLSKGKQGPRRGRVPQGSAAVAAAAPSSRTDSKAPSRGGVSRLPGSAVRALRPAQPRSTAADGAAASASENSRHRGAAPHRPIPSRLLNDTPTHRPFRADSNVIG